jgi:hypothetical protein
MKWDSVLSELNAWNTVVRNSLTLHSPPPCKAHCCIKEYRVIPNNSNNIYCPWDVHLIQIPCCTFKECCPLRCYTVWSVPCHLLVTANVPTLPILLPWWWRRYIPLKQVLTRATQCNIPKTAFFIVTAVKTSNRNKTFVYYCCLLWMLTQRAKHICSPYMNVLLYQIIITVYLSRTILCKFEVFI